MHATIFLTLLSGAALLTEASPIEKRGLGFNLTQQVHGQRLKNGPLALAKVYDKFKKPMPSRVSKAACAASATATVIMKARSADEEDIEKRAGKVAATPENAYDTAYMIPVTVGGTTLYFDLDTGSSDFWAMSALQPASQTSGHTVYTPSKSLFKGQSWNLTYLDGSGASGSVYYDTVVLGGMTFKNQIIEAASSVSSSFTSSTHDGMLGLAFSNLNMVRPVSQLTLFDSIKGQLTKQLFTSNLKSTAVGSYTFGYIDSTQYTGAITYAPVNSANGWWQFTTDGYSIGSGAPVTNSYQGVVDTGTTLMVLPAEIVTAYYGKVQGAYYNSTYGAWIYPCASTMPNFNILVASVPQTVPGSLMTYGPIDFAGNCYGGLQQNDGLGIAIYGDIFIKSQLVVYDMNAGSPQVGFARQTGLNYTGPAS